MYVCVDEQVFINAWAIHRDTAKWGQDAEEFKPQRHLDQPLDFQGQDFNFIPFGFNSGCSGKLCEPV